MFHKISSIENSLGLERRWVSRFSVKIVLSHSAKKLRRGTLRCFRKFLVSKIFMDKRGISRFSVGIYLAHSTEKL